MLLIMTALKKAIKIVAKGNQTEFAKKVSEQVRLFNDSTPLTTPKIPELSQQLVSLWVRNDTPCSAHYAQIISNLTGGKVSAAQLRPDVFLPANSCFTQDKQAA